MAERAVINASPLIFLSRADLIDLLQLISSETIVPEIVASEIEMRGKSDRTAQALTNNSWLVVTQTPPVHTLINEASVHSITCSQNTFPILGWNYPAGISLLTKGRERLRTVLH